MLVSIQKLREAAVESFHKTAELHAKLLSVLEMIPKETPDAVEAVHLNGYCADFTIEFKPLEDEALVHKLLRLFPPMELVRVEGTTVAEKPVAYLRDHERIRAHLVPIYPVIYRDKPGYQQERSTGVGLTACWWSQLSCGVAQLQVPVSCPFAGVPQEDAERHIGRSQTYAGGRNVNYLERKLAEVPVQDSPLAMWENEWKAYTDGLRASQRAFANAIKTLILIGEEPLRFEDLPQPHYCPGSMAVPIENDDPVGTLQARMRREAERKPHVLDSIGDFWMAFDMASARELVEFSARMAEALPEARAEEAKAEERVRQAVIELLGQYASYSHEAPSFRRRCVEQWLARKTGLRMEVMNLSVKYGKGHAWIRFHHRSSGFEFWFEASGGDEELCPQDIEVVYA